MGPLMIARRYLRRHAFAAITGIALLLAISSACWERAASQAPFQCPPWHAKLDQSVHQTLDRGTSDRISVIIRAGATSRKLWRQALTNHGDVVRRDLVGVGAFGAVVHLDDVNVLASDPSIQ